MLRLLPLIILFWESGILSAQVMETSRVINKSEVDALGADSLIINLTDEYPIYKAYEFIDNSGSYLVLLTEKQDTIINSDTLHFSINALCFRRIAGNLKQVWKISDGLSGKQESSIWFWTKYCSFTDIDSDGLIDPVIVYGTSGDANGIADGRLNILTMYKDQKCAIHHLNGTLDFERKTSVDASFYSLPKPVKSFVMLRMQNIEDDRSSIFPYQWQKAMHHKKLHFKEN